MLPSCLHAFAGAIPSAWDAVTSPSSAHPNSALLSLPSSHASSPRQPSLIGPKQQTPSPSIGPCSVLCLHLVHLCLPSPLTPVPSTKAVTSLGSRPALEATHKPWTSHFTSPSSIVLTCKIGQLGFLLEVSPGSAWTVWVHAQNSASLGTPAKAVSVVPVAERPFYRTAGNVSLPGFSLGSGLRTSRVAPPGPAWSSLAAPLGPCLCAICPSTPAPTTRN